MKTIRPQLIPMARAMLAIVLFITALGLQAQTPPSAPRQLPVRLGAGTNRPAATPKAAPGSPSASGSPVLPGATASTSPSTASPSTAMPPTTAATIPALPVPATAIPVVPSPLPATTPPAEVPGYTYDFPGVDVQQVLDIYADLIGRTLLRGGLPNASIVLHTQSPLTKTEAIEALQAVLALNGIAVVNIGDKFCKVAPVDQAPQLGAKLDSTAAENLPELGTYITHITQLKYVLPSKMLPIIQPLGKLKDIIALDDNGILVIRDYAENVKRMLEMIEKIDISVPAVYVSEVIPIRYAQAEDIASALNSLGGSGGATVSFGGSTAAPGINGFGGQRSGTSPFGSNPQGTQGSGLGTYGSQTGRTLGNNTSTMGTQASGITTPGSGAPGTTPFQQRLMNIINRASTSSGGPSGQENIQIFGNAKIIADERSNSLLIFATRQDMDQIKSVIKQLDVLLAQVLIEAAIIDYSLGPNTLDFGISAAQQKKDFNTNPNVQTAGLMNNNQPFYNFVQSVVTNGGILPGIAGNPPNNLNYWGNIGQTWAVALQAAAADSHASIVQRPRIQTSQAKPAQFFVGQTVPYVTSTYNYGGINGNQSSYSQLSVGVELDVTPFINPDGLVVMDINQEIDNISGSTQIQGVGSVPNTDKRTLSSEIAVRDRDTVMLGGFIYSEKDTSRTGVPMLMDIPLLGNLFLSRHDSKQRQELIVLMHPTVLKTPALAAAQAVVEQQRLPGVTRVEAEDMLAERKNLQSERSWETKNHVNGVPEQSGGEPIAPAPVDTSTPSPQNYFAAPASVPAAIPTDNNSGNTPSAQP